MARGNITSFLPQAVGARYGFLKEEEVGLSDFRTSVDDSLALFKISFSLSLSLSVLLSFFVLLSLVSLSHSNTLTLSAVLNPLAHIASLSVSLIPSPRKLLNSLLSTPISFSLFLSSLSVVLPVSPCVSS